MPAGLPANEIDAYAAVVGACARIVTAREITTDKHGPQGVLYMAAHEFLMREIEHFTDDLAETPEPEAEPDAEPSAA